MGLVLGASVLEVLDLAPALQLRSRALTVAASFIGVLPAVVAVACVLLLVGLRGWWRLVAVALALAVGVQLVVQAPRRAVPDAVRPNLVVLEQNTYYGWADPAALARRASSAGADIVVLPEVTTRTLSGLDATGWNSRYPYRAGSAVGDWNDAGLMVFARYPLRVTDAGPHAGVGLRLTVDLPEGPLTLVAVHFANPLDAWGAWTDDFTWLGRAVRTSTPPLVVAGDFNAVPQHEQLRHLLRTAGLRDAAAQVGDVWAPTFPSPRSYPPPGRWAIPVMQLDHVLVGAGVTPSDLTTFRIDGTDHRGLVAGLRVG